MPALLKWDGHLSYSHMKEVVYQTSGTCSQAIRVQGENGRIVDVQFLGGCHGNLQGISSLVRGQRYEDVIARVEGIQCGMKGTSCPDQLAHALRQLMEEDRA